MTHRPHQPAPLLIALPHALGVSGVASWARTLARGLALQGTLVALITHDTPADRFALAPREPFDHFPLENAPPLDTCAGQYAPYLPHYRAVIDRLLARSAGRPIVALPSLSAECYGLFAALTRDRPGALRILSWTHSDIQHDYHIARHYEPLLHRFVGVSSHITARLAHQLGADRAADTLFIPYGVDVPPQCPARPELVGRPVRLVYTGRLEQPQKRLSALLALARVLTHRRLPHEFLLMGDGPAADDARRAARDLPSLRVEPPGSQPVAQALAHADFFLLASRYEGLSVAMLEAMAQGCVPIVTDIASGAADAIPDERVGRRVPLLASDEAQAEALADAIETCLPRAAAMSRAAWSAARERFTIDMHLRRAQALIESAADAPPRDWPAHREPAAARSDGVGFSVPRDAADRARLALDQLAGRQVALWGSGRHTRAIAPALRASRAHVLAAIDDDPARWGAEIEGLPIVSATHAKALGATDVLISSAMHEAALWERRAELESLGLRVSRIYG